MMLYALYNFASWDHSVLYEQFQDPDAVVGLADGGADVAFICDASMPTYLLTHWVRDRTRGPRVPLAEAVRRVTSQTAELYGLTDRGRIAPGLRADINVIDHASMTLSTPAAVHDLPVGGVRLLQSATGYDVTMVAGEVTRRHGVDTGARPGRLLRAGVEPATPGRADNTVGFQQRTLCAMLQTVFSPPVDASCPADDAGTLSPVAEGATQRVLAVR